MAPGFWTGSEQTKMQLFSLGSACEVPEEGNHNAITVKKMGVRQKENRKTVDPRGNKSMQIIACKLVSHRIRIN
jgi:hypothetical protein